MNKLVKIKVDGMIFDSLVKAAKFIKCNAYSISNKFTSAKSNKIEFKGHSVEKIEANNLTVKSNAGRKKVKVKCVTTGEIFNSISDAAKALGINAWTFGLKMETNGKYVDAQGKEYVRETPINRSTNTEYKRTKNDTIISKPRHEMIKDTIIETVENLDVEKTVEKMVASKTEEIRDLERVATKLAAKSKYSEAAMIYELLNTLTTK